VSLNRHPLHTLFIITSLVAASATACLPSQVEVLCTDIAFQRCIECDDCTKSVENVGVQDLCSTNDAITSSLVPEDAFNASQLEQYNDLAEDGQASGAQSARQRSLLSCVEQRSNLCANQASVREDPNTELNLCLDELVNETCDDLFQSFALDQNTTVEACGRFL